MSKVRLFSEYLISLQSSQIHHVIAQLGHLGHQVYRFLWRENQHAYNKTCMTFGNESKLLQLFEYQFLSFFLIHFFFFYKNLKCNQLILWLTIFFKKTSEHFIFTSICWQSNPAFMLYFKKSLSNKINCTLIKHFYSLLVSIAASKTSFLLYL